MTDHGDPACVSALAKAIGHEPPFTDDELASVESLTLTHARDVTPLAGCTGLKRLRLIASELPRGMHALEAVVALERLEVFACRLRATNTGAENDTERTTLLFTALKDPDWAGGEVSSALSEGGVVVGVPFTTEYAEYVAECGHDYSEYDRRQAVALWERTGAVCGQVADEYGLVVRPGLPTLTGNTVDALHMSTAEVEQALTDPDLTLESLFQRHADRVVDPDLDQLLALRPTRPLAGIRRWLTDAEVRFDERASFDRFLHRFPEVLLTPPSPEQLDRTEKAYEECRLNEWELRRRLARWMLLRDCPPVRFAGLPGITYAIGLPADDPDPADNLLKPGFQGLSWDIDAGYLVVGRAVERPGSILLYRWDDAGQISVADEEELDTALAQRRQPATAMTVAFGSLVEMLDRVESVHPELRAPVIGRSGVRGGGRQLHLEVRRELRRLRAAVPESFAPADKRVSTPVGEYPLNPAIQAFQDVDWPAGHAVRTPDGLRVYPLHVPVEPDLLPEPRAWYGIAEDEAQYYWVVDLADPNPDDPQVYRVDHDGNDQMPASSQNLSRVLAGLTLTPLEG